MDHWPAIEKNPKTTRRITENIQIIFTVGQLFNQLNAIKCVVNDWYVPTLHHVRHIHTNHFCFCRRPKQNQFLQPPNLHYLAMALESLYDWQINRLYLHVHLYVSHLQLDAQVQNQQADFTQTLLWLHPPRYLWCCQHR